MLNSGKQIRALRDIKNKYSRKKEDTKNKEYRIKEDGINAWMEFEDV